MSFELAALAAAFTWALSGLIAAEPSRRLGGPRFTRLRMILVSIFLFGIASLFGDWTSIPTDAPSIGLLVGSAFLGLVVGDAALFTAFARFGPRRTAIVFTTNAPMAAILGAVVFGEAWTVGGIVGTVMIIAGVLVAVFFGTRPGQTHRFEEIVGHPWTAFGWALLGALGQAIGAIMVKPVFEAGAGTWAVAATRVLIATPAMWLLARPLDRVAKPVERAPMTPRLWGSLALSALLAMVIGTTLLLWAINNGPVGPATVLSSTTPIMMLPLLWISTRQRPGIWSWVGAAVAFGGTTLLVVS